MTMIDTLHSVSLIADRDRRVTRQAGADAGSHQSVPSISSAGGCAAFPWQRCQILTINAMAVKPVYVLHVSEQVLHMCAGPPTVQISGRLCANNEVRF